jgi:AcrR family transcriptional regulator
VSRSPRTPAPRARNAAGTRAAILASARTAFARAGYDGAGVREIAKGAGVTAMLVNRYFGSKEALFGEVVAAVMQTPTILRPEVIAAGGATVAQMLLSITRADAPPLEGFAIMLHSSASEPAARIAREQLEQHYQKTLAALLGDAQRSALFLALVAGIQIMRQSIALTALADERRLAAALAPVIDLLLAPPPAKKPAR